MLINHLFLWRADCVTTSRFLSPPSAFHEIFRALANQNSFSLSHDVSQISCWLNMLFFAVSDGRRNSSRCHCNGFCCNWSIRMATREICNCLHNKYLHFPPFLCILRYTSANHWQKEKDNRRAAFGKSICSPQKKISSGLVVD
jgi:hypothetical protein